MRTVIVLAFLLGACLYELYAEAKLEKELDENERNK